MLKFLVYDNGQPSRALQLCNAHLLGPELIGERGTITFQDGEIRVVKRSSGPVALCLQYDCPDVGRLTLQTCLLPDRDAPYLLSLELARHRLMLILAKQEDWMMFDLAADHPVMRRLQTARSRFIAALCDLHDPPTADEHAHACLGIAVDASEELALAHAEMLLKRRREAGQFHRGVFGCGVSPCPSHLDGQQEKLRASLQSNFDYLMLPIRWRQIEPQEQQFNWRRVDGWAEWAYRNRVPILAGPVLSLESAVAPSWLAVMQHDYETLRDIIYEHVERVLSRYKNVVTLWNVASGLHVNDQFDLTLDQLMDLTRMAVMLVKKIQPNAKTLVEITHPFGEYYAENPRSVPPMVYAEMVLQSGIPVDAFGLRVTMGRAEAGHDTRDLMQISTMLDRFNGLGKPLHLTGVGVPSAMAGADPDADADADVDVDVAEPREDGPTRAARGEAGGGVEGESTAPVGYWRKPWSPVVQAHWLEAFYHLALSKPFVDSIAWLELADHAGSDLPHGGLADDNLRAKSAFHRVVSVRRQLHAAAQAARNRARA